MQIQVRDLDFSGLQVSQEQSGSRTPGIHVSSIIRHLVTTAGLQKDNDFTENDLDHYALVGRLWEQMLADVYYTKPRYERVGEIELDGIIGSPDAVDLTDYGVEEMKVTWGSARDFENRIKFRLYRWQVAAYCNMLGTLRARLTVLHLNGDYRPPLPCGKEYFLLFTPGELRDNWAMLKRGAAELE